jgi:hypothetical protein
LPPRIKRERSEDDESVRHITPRTEHGEEEEVDEKAMVKIVAKILLSDDEGILEQALKRLGKYLVGINDAGSTEKQKAFSRVGGHFAIVMVLKRYPDCRGLQICGIGVLANALNKDASLRTVVAELGGIQTILAAMRRFPSHYWVIRNGFAALCNIVSDHATNADLLVTKIGQVPFLLERMKEFQAEADVMQSACYLMWNLSHFEQLRRPIADAQAATALAAVFDRHRSTPAIRQAARKTMVNLLMDDLD